MRNEDKQARVERKSAFISALDRARRQSFPEPVPDRAGDADGQKVGAVDRLPGHPEPAPTPAAEQTGSGESATGAPGDQRAPARRAPVGLAPALLAILAGCVVAAVLAFSLPDYYYSQAEILIDPRGADRATIDSRLRIIASGTVIREVVDRLDLDRDPEFNRETGASFPGLFELFRRKAAENAALNSKAIAARTLVGSLSVKSDEKSRLVTIGAMSQDPRKAARIANTVTAVFFNADARIDKQSQMGTARSDPERISSLRNAAEAAENRVDAFRNANDIPGPDAISGLDKEIAATAEAFAAARADKSSLDDPLDEIENLSVSDLVSEGLPTNPSTGALKESRDQYVSLKRDTDRLALSLGDRHPLLRGMRERLAQMRAALGDQLRKTVQSLKQQRALAISRIVELSARLDDLKAQKERSGKMLAELKGLEQAASGARSLYENSLLNSQTDTAEQLPETPRFTQISKAEPPLSPAGPQRLTIIFAGGLLGLVLGILISRVGRAARGYHAAPSVGMTSGTKNSGVSGLAAESANANEPVPETGDGSAAWPSPEMMPANPYGGPVRPGRNVTPAAYRGVAGKSAGSNSFSAGDADIATLKERLEAFREKIGRASNSRFEEDQS